MLVDINESKLLIDHLVLTDLLEALIHQGHYDLCHYNEDHYSLGKNKS